MFVRSFRSESIIQFYPLGILVAAIVALASLGMRADPEEVAVLQACRVPVTALSTIEESSGIRPLRMRFICEEPISSSTEWVWEKGDSGL